MTIQAKKSHARQTKRALSKQHPSQTRPSKESSSALAPELQRALTDVEQLTQPAVLALQRAIGNRGVNDLIQRQPETRQVVQLKLFQSYQGALNRHQRDLAAVHEAVTEGLAQNEDRRLKNSCEWVRQGTAGKRIYAQTPTHDSFKRARAANKPLGTIAVFPNFGKGGHMYNAGALNQAHQTYDRSVNNNENVYFEDEGVFSQTSGLQSPGDGVAIIRASSQGKTKIWETLRHEVQHAADYHGGGRNDGDKWFEGFKTEFRAYSLEGSNLGQLSMTKQVKKRGYTWTERQYGIFSHIYSGYPHTKNGWDQNPQLKDGRSFRQAVVEFKLPYSVNPQNSIRVDKFVGILQELHADTFEAIEKSKVPETNSIVRMTKERMENLMAAIADLQPVEKRVILSNPDIKLREHLTDLVGAEGGPATELPPDYIPFVEETGERQDDYVEFLLTGMGQVYWAKDTELEEYLTGHLLGRDPQKLIAFEDPPPAKISYLYENPLLSKAYTHVTTALRAGAAERLPPSSEIFG